MKPAIAVKIVPHFDRAGEYLADVRALEAAGVDSLWLDGDEDPWIVLAATAVATVRMRLCAACTAADAKDLKVLARRVATLRGLARDRLVLSVAEPGLVEPVALAARCPVFFEVRAGGTPAAGEIVPAVVRLARGHVLPADLPASCRAHRDRVLAARSSLGLDDALEFWAGVLVPADRAAWRRTLLDHAAAGATGVVVPHDQRLLDLLRNPDAENDRSDLFLAQG